MKAFFSILNKVIKTSQVSKSPKTFSTTPEVFASKTSTVVDSVRLSRNTVPKFNMEVCNFPELTSNYQNAIKNNADELGLIFDLVKTGEVPKETALKELFSILNKSYAIEGEIQTVTGFRGAYAEYVEFLNKIKVNETLPMDEIIAHYSHEVQHFKQAIDINRAVPLKEKFKQIAKMESDSRIFKSLEEKNRFIETRAKELETLHKNAGWQRILSDKGSVGSKEFRRGRELYKSDCVPYHQQNHLGEIESYTTGTSTYIELQRSVNKTISKQEYDILNEINIVLHENYCELPEDLRKLTVSINLHPEKFVEDIKYAVREIGMADTEKIIKDFLVPLMNM